jgi:sirohydrochlorin ferrochelatase
MRRAGIFMALGLVACASTPSSKEQLAAAIARQINEPASDYRHAFVDLNGDSIEDAIVLLQGSGWCGSGGCTMLVMKGERAGYSFLSRSTVTSAPVRVASKGSHGWKSLIVHSSGAARLMTFDGDGYPLNPSMQPAADQDVIESARTVLAQDTP